MMKSPAVVRTTWSSILLLTCALLAPQMVGAEPPAVPPAKALSVPPSLVATLDPILQSAAIRNTQYGVHVVNVRTGDEVYSRHGDQAFMPASTMKVLTTSMALRTLGPAYRFRTEILHDGTLGDDGVLDGNLYVKGYGDPTLVVEKLWKMVRDMRLNGVREIKGNVVFDDTYFDRNSGVPGWNKKVDIANGPSYDPPLGALSLNYNTVAIVMGPGASQGAAARVELESDSAVIKIENHATTGSTGARHWVKVEREVEGAITRFEITGVVPAGIPTERYYRAVGDSTAYFTGAFAGLIKAEGIKVGGRWDNGQTPTDATLLVRTESAPLSAIMADTNKYSNNFMAEMTLKALGAQVHGLPGTTEKGLQAIAAYLGSLGISSSEYQIVNGSGLSLESSLRPEHLTAVMTDLYNDQLVGPEFMSSLAIGGVDGTLRYRFREPDEVGRIRGKTGSLNGVYCLVGYVNSADGDVFAFAFLANDISGPLSQVRSVHSRFAEALFDVDQAPSPVAEEEEVGDPAP